MSKKLVVCFDGTWNKPKLFEPSSNVVNLYQSMLVEDMSSRKLRGPTEQPKVPTIKWYDTGVGSRWWNRFRGGITGNGLSRSIREGYKFLIDHYENGDEIYLFGFSRGAYTARSLAGLIRKIGLLKKEHAPHEKADDNPTILEGFAIYRQRDDSPDTAVADNFKNEYSWPNVRIKFIGVWDTVGSLGIPLDIFEGLNDHFLGFHDARLSRIVENAYHAVAIDEHRADYEPTMWDPESQPQQQMEQVWFVGAHSDVGGGSSKTSLSGISLGWMQQKAQLEGDGLEFRGITDVNDQYLTVRPSDPFGELLFRVFRILRGRKDERNLRPVNQLRYGHESLHETVARKREQDRHYNPQNIGMPSVK